MPPYATFSLLKQSLPQGLLMHDRRIHHSMQECMKFDERPATSKEQREENKQKALSEFLVKGQEAYAVRKDGLNGIIKKYRLGHGNPVNWTTPRFTVGKEQIKKKPIHTPPEKMLPHEYGPCRRRPLDPNIRPDTV